MYSVVLMIALAGGTETPDCHRGHGGGCGCYGNSGCGCYGHSGCGCYGYSSCGSCCNSCSSCSSCCSSCGCYGGGYGGGCGCYGGGWGSGYYGMPGGSGGDKGGSGKDDNSKGGKVGSGEISAPATIVVNLPENAKLKVDDYVTTSTSSNRTFQTPALPAGREFSYTLTAEVERDGKTVSVSKQITVRGGQVTETKIELPVAVAE